MRKRRLWWLAAGLGLLAGCASTGKTPKYVTNFDQVRPGMTQSQVRGLLGWPSLVATHADVQAHVIVPDSNDQWSALKQDVNSIFSDGELWQYGTYSVSDWEQPPELMDGSPKSFLVYFDATGHVVRARKPLQGPYGSPTGGYGARPSATPSPSPSELWSGDPFGRDKGSAGPTTQP
jgi:hypothetical protein